MQCTHSTVCELDKSSFFTETLILTFIFQTFPRISKILTYQKCWKIMTKGLIWIFAPKSKKLSETSDALIFMLKIWKMLFLAQKFKYWLVCSQFPRKIRKMRLFIEFWDTLKMIDFTAQKYLVNTVFICFQFKMLGMFLRQFVAAVKLICKVGKIGLPLEL